MAPKLTLIDDIVAGRIDWKMIVRVMDLWEVTDFNNPQITNSVEMILIDQKVSK